MQTIFSWLPREGNSGGQEGETIKRHWAMFRVMDMFIILIMFLAGHILFSMCNLLYVHYTSLNLFKTLS